jgi:hypothetical protein
MVTLCVGGGHQRIGMSVVSPVARVQAGVEVAGTGQAAAAAVATVVAAVLVTLGGVWASPARDHTGRPRRGARRWCRGRRRVRPSATPTPTPQC